MLEKYNLAWLEDMVPWQYTDLLKKISDAVDIPILTGEDIYLKESSIELARAHAVDIVQPDLATSGGILETKKIGDACSVDVAWWDTLVEGVEKPIVNKGYIPVPDKPGLGVTLNEDVVKQHLAEPGFFEPTPQWNTDRTNDRQWS